MRASRFITGRGLRAAAVASVLFLATGCTMALRPGPTQGEAPPRLINIDGKIIWDNPAAFGPVPALLKDHGEKVCASMNTRWQRFHPTGYHAHAQMLDGTPFWAGGYYCE